MGHHAAKEIYDDLADSLDGASARLPKHEALRQLLQELYSPDEAELVAKMPWRLSQLERLCQIMRLDCRELETRLTRLADRGLVLDLVKTATGARYYMPSPFIIGIFEFTMMRVGPSDEVARLARLFREYLESPEFYRANFGNGQQVFVARTLAHTDTFDATTEVLSADRVEAILEQATQYAVGICSCRHQAAHTTGRTCSTPLETCTAMGTAAEYLVRHGLARPIERAEMREIVARSRAEGLVLCADNVKADVGFICHCCTCCCHMIRGITEFGYPNTITTSAFAPALDATKCSGCNRCADACPVSALSHAAPAGELTPCPHTPRLDMNRCIGCGICATRCRRQALQLIVTDRRRILPESSFERVVLQCLERGTMQNLIFDNPQSFAQRPMRALLGGLLGLPRVKRALVSEAFRSTFLRGLSALSSYDGP